LGAEPKPEREPSLRPGTLIGDRFLVRRFLGAGGMGEVYEAEDLQLHSASIALKTIRPEFAMDEAARFRLKNEVCLARSITHPNVCPVYDIFCTRTVQTELWFYTMKLLQGETLAARLQRMSVGPQDAVRIAADVARGLDAIHETGIVHRDLKPGNIFLEARPTSERAVLTDFGLARSAKQDAALTLAGHAVGTPSYIAPEVRAGKPATAAADIYAFGVVLAELFEQQRSASVAPAGTVSVTEARNIDTVISRCLSWDSTQRYQSGAEVLRALEAATVPALAQTEMAFPTTLPRRRWMLGCFGLAASAATTWISLEKDTHPLPARRLVAAMIWPQVQDVAIASVLNQLLDSVCQRLARATYDKDFLLLRNTGAPGEALAPGSPAEAAGILGANLVLAAAMSKTQHPRLLLSVIDPTTGKSIRRDWIAEPRWQQSQIADTATRKAARLLNVRLENAHESESDDFAHVAAPAYQAFSEAEALMRADNVAGLDRAIPKYQEALRIDSHFAAAYAGLTIAYLRRFSLYGDPTSLMLASSNARLASEYHPNSLRTRFADALVKLSSGQTEAALQQMRELLTRDPGNPDILMYEAMAFRELGNSALEEQVYKNLLALRPNYWPAYNDLGSLELRKGHYSTASSYFKKATEVAPKAALPWANLSSAYVLNGDMADARDACQRSIAAFPNHLAYINLGNIAYEQRNYRQALNYYQRAKDLSPNFDMTWRNIGDCYTMLAQPALMRESYQRAAAIVAAQLGVNPRSGSKWMTLAYYSAKAGNFAAARKDLAQAEERNPAGPSVQLLKAQTLVLLGEKERAVRLLEDLLSHGLSRTELDLAIDLHGVMNDPRIRAALQRAS
jgi:tetratricopeptide (TPR) repeat protein